MYKSIYLINENCKNPVLRMSKRFLRHFRCKPVSFKVSFKNRIYHTNLCLTLVIFYGSFWKFSTSIPAHFSPESPLPPSLPWDNYFLQCKSENHGQLKFIQDFFFFFWFLTKQRQGSKRKATSVASDLTRSMVLSEVLWF